MATVTVPIASLKSLKGLPKTLDISLNKGTCVHALRNKLTELTGDHRSIAGLAYKGRVLSDCDEFPHDCGNGAPKVIVFDQIPGQDCNYHFFPTSDGKTLTIDARNDYRTKFVGFDIAKKRIEFNRNVLTKAIAHRRKECCVIKMPDDIPPAINCEPVHKAERVSLHEICSDDLALNVMVHKFYNLGVNQVPHLCIVGGVHGNETSGIKGAKSILKFLQSGKSWLSREILRRSSVTIIPCINSVGYSANARSCPTFGTKCLWDKTGKVYIGDHQHGGLFPPAGWQDPNRGWKNNNTLVKRILERSLFSKGEEKPDMVVFNHDWAVPNGVLMARGVEDKQAWAGAKELFTHYYPSRTGYGKPYEHLIELSVPSEDKWVNGEPECLTSCLVQYFGTPNYTIETYCGSEDGHLLHFEVTLFLLAKHCGIDGSNDELRAMVRECSFNLL